MAASLGVDNPFRYRGYYYDVESGLYYLNARYYNPQWGRFINADSYGGSTGQLLSHNVFVYCSNNSVMMSDPSGNREIITGDANSREERVLQTLYRIAKRLPKELQKDFHKKIDGIDPKTLVIDITSIEKLTDVYDPNDGTKSLVHGGREAGLSAAFGYFLGPVFGVGLEGVFLLFDSMAAQQEEDIHHSCKGVYTNYNITFSAGGNLNQIELRLQPPGYDWQPYSWYYANTYINESSHLISVP